MRNLRSIIAKRPIQAVLLIGALFLALFIAALVHPDTGHAGFGSIFLSLVEIVVPKLLWAIAFLIISYGTGHLVLDLIRVSNSLDTIEDDILYSIATGLGLIGLGALFLGSVGLLQPWLHISMGIGLAGASWKQIRGLFEKFGKLDLSGTGRIEIFLLLTIVIIALWGIPKAMFPEWGFDSLNSHLPAPRTYIEEGRILFHPEINFDNFPETVEMWFMESMMVLGWSKGTSAPLLMGFCHLLITLAVFAMGKRFFSCGAGLTGALIYLLIPKAFLFAGLAFIDQGLALMVALGTYAVLRYIEKPSSPVAILAGLCFGFACGIKYSALIAVAIMAILAIAFEFFGRKKFASLIVDLLLALGVMILICCPWYIRNWIWFHNPVFPFYADKFLPGGIYAIVIDDLKVNYSSMLSMFALPYGKSAIEFLKLPYTLLVNPFSPYDAKGVGVLGPWFTFSLSLIFFTRKYPRILIAISAAVILTFAYWWFIEGMLHLRYMLPVFSIMAAFSGFLVWNGLRLGNINWRSGIGTLVLLAVMCGCVAYFHAKVIPTVTKTAFPITPSEKLQFEVKQMSALPVVEALNKSFQKAGILKKTRVYGFYMEQCRWIARFTLVGNQVGYADHADYLAHTNSAEELYNWLRGYNIDFLIVNTPYAQMQIGQDASKADPGGLPGYQQYFQPIGNGLLPVYQMK